MGYELTPDDPSLADPLPDAPFQILVRWLNEARALDLTNPDAMIVSTVADDGGPRSRTVLCRGVDVERGSLTFYTNQRSDKARHIAARPQVSALFYWDRLARQVCAAGIVEKVGEAASDAYWVSRPRLSQLAAWGSDQSEPVESRAALLARIEAAAESFGGIDGTVPVPRPAHWGGYRIVVREMELWVGAAGRVHDRVRWRRADADAPWSRQRRQP